MYRKFLSLILNIGLVIFIISAFLAALSFPCLGVLGLLHIIGLINIPWWVYIIIFGNACSIIFIWLIVVNKVLDENLLDELRELNLER